MQIRRILQRLGRSIVLERDILKVSLLRHRHADGYFASMHQAGNHWLRHIFGLMLARKFGVPEPSHINDLRVIGGATNPTEIAGVPVLVFSHRIPSRLVHSTPLRQIFPFPRTVLVLRDLRAALVSNYERFKEQYGCTFSEYLRGDINGRRFNCDIWDCIRFLNAWGRVLRIRPDETTCVRYEDLKTRTVDEVQRIWEFLQLAHIDRGLVALAVAGSTKEQMAAKEEEGGKGTRVIRMSDRHPHEWFSRVDQRFLKRVCAEHLRFPMDYDYENWTISRAA